MPSQHKGSAIGPRSSLSDDFGRLPDSNSDNELEGEEEATRSLSTGIVAVSRDSMTVPGAHLSARGGMPKASSAGEKLVDWLLLPLEVLILCLVFLKAMTRSLILYIICFISNSFSNYVEEFDREQ